MIKSPARDRPRHGSQTSPLPIDRTQRPDVASNLRRIRRQLGLSLEALAKLSGVSRAMLGQIETGKSVPTITLVWKVAQALGVAATDLIAASPEVRSVHVSRSKQRNVMYDSGRLRYRAYDTPEFPMPFSVSEILVEAGHREEFPGAGVGAMAALIVITGAIELAIDRAGVPSRVEDGDAILFNASFEHALFNPGPKPAIVHLIVSSPRNLRA